MTIETKEETKTEIGKTRHLGYRDGDAVHFHKWFEHHVHFSVDSKVTLKQCYDSYTYFLMKDLVRVPLSKKAFASLLRSHLAGDDQDSRVRIVTRASVIIERINGNEGIEEASA